MTAQTELRMIAPSDLIIDTNVRHDPKADKSFVASIKQHGVLSAITGQADDEGHVHVRMGQRRTLAAIEAGRDEVPVMVLPAEASADEAARIIEQLAENDHRAAITDNDRVAAVEALTGLGLSAGQIQRRTNRPKAEVAAAITVNESQSARKAVTDATLTLEQGAVLAEFEDDPEAVEELMQTAQDGHGFEHRAQRIRDERERAVVVAAAEEDLTRQGITVTDPPVFYGIGSDTGSEYPRRTRLTDLVTPGDRENITEEDHAQCEGHAASVRAVFNREDEQGRYRAEVRYLCTDPKKYGHADRYAASSGKTPAAEMTEEEREQAKAARREVIDNNKAWEAAETVRRDWLTDYLTRKSAPKDAAPFIAAALAKGWGGADVGHHTVPGMLDGLGVDATAEAAEKVSQSRALVLVLARVLAAYEAQTSREDWRTTNPGTRAYLMFLAAHGYDLSEVEQRAAATN